MNFLLFIKLVFLLLSLLGSMLILQRKLRVPSAFTPLLSLCSISIILHLFMIIGLLPFAAFIIYFIGIIAFGYYAYIHYKEKERTAALLAFPQWIFIGLYIITFFLFKNKIFSVWDEFSFWGTSLKELVISNKIYGLNFYDFPEYPRGLTVLQYYFTTKLTDQLHEGIAIFAQVLLLVAAIPIVVYKNKKSIINIVLTSLIFFLAYYALCTPIYYLYADNAIAMLLGSALGMYFITQQQKQSILFAAIPLSMITITKPIGLVFAAIGFFIIGTHFAFNYLKKASLKTQLKPFILALVLFCAVAGSWKAFLAVNNSNYSKSSSDITTGILNPPAYFGKIKQNYINAFVFGEKEVGSAMLKPKTIYTDIKKYTGISIPGLEDASNINLGALFLLLLFGLITFLFRKKLVTYFPKKHSLLITIIAITLSIVGYSILLVLIYTFIFYDISSYEAFQLASYYRYIGCLLLAFFISLTILIYSHQKKYTIYSIITLISLVFLVPRSFASQLNTTASSTENYKQRTQLKTLVDAITTENPNVKGIAFLNDDVLEDMNVYRFKYEALPIPTNGEISNLKPYLEKHSIEDLKKELNNYDVFVIGNESEAEKMKDFFTKHQFKQKIYIYKQ